MAGARSLIVSLSILVAGGCDGTIGAGEGIEASGVNQSSVVAAEPGWTLVDQFEQTGAMAAKFNPVDGAIYFGGRTSSSLRRGLWRVEIGGAPQRIGGSFQVGGVVVDPCTGDVFVGDDFPGITYRSVGGRTAPARWVAGYHRGDDDPVGMAIAPMDHTSGVVAPGEIVVVDRGSNGPDEVWAFSSVTPEGERAIHPDNGTLVDGVDVAISRTAVYVADQGRNRIYRVLPDRTLEPIAMPPLRPSSIAVDPRTQELLVVDLNTGSIVRVDPDTGDGTTIFTGLSVNTDNFGGLDVTETEDGLRLVITERGTPVNGTITVFEFKANQAPVAVCQNTVVELDAVECAAFAAIDGGSFDPDGDDITVEVSDEGPYPPGDTEVTLTVTDSQGLSTSCTAVVTVESNSTGWFADNAVSDPEVHGGNSDHAMIVWGFFGGGTTIFDFEDVVFEAQDDDSSARMTGLMRVREDGCDGVHDGELWTLDVYLDPALDTTRPKLELKNPDVNQPPSVTDEWRFFGLADGSRIYRADGLAFADLHQRPADLRFGFQVGFTANGKNTNFGMSGWLFYDHTEEDGTMRSGKGDFNVDLEPICE